MRTNFLFFIQAYSDQCQTSTPALSNFQWSRQIDGVPYTVENSQQIQVPISTTTSNILPFTFSNVLANTTGNISTGTNVFTVTGATTGIFAGQLIVGAGIPANTTVISIVGSLVTMSNLATATTVGVTGNFYLPATFIYLESDQIVSVIYNSGSPMTLTPFQINGITKPAVFFMAGPSTSLTVTNAGTATANIFFASMG
jgi:hypothetical protein